MHSEITGNSDSPARVTVKGGPAYAEISIAGATSLSVAFILGPVLTQRFASRMLEPAPNRLRSRQQQPTAASPVAAGGERRVRVDPPIDASAVGIGQQSATLSHSIPRSVHQLAVVHPRRVRHLSRQICAAPFPDGWVAEVLHLRARY